MAAVRERRQVNLKLPEFTHFRPLFPLPLSNPLSTAQSPSVIALNELEKLQVLGHGNGGTVYKVRHKRTSQFYALKLLHSAGNPQSKRQSTSEINILKRTNSPHIVHCHDVVMKPSGDIAIVMEYMEGGSLEARLRERGPFSEPDLADVARHVLNGLGYLHSMKIVHRDIKPANLLVTGDMVIKIADFGVSKFVGKALDSCKSYVGTCAYMSPERFDPESYGGNYDGYAGDVWSLGLTLLELYVGHFPLLDYGQRPDWATLMCAICFGERPALPDGASDAFRGFVACCLEKDASNRWTVAQLLTHPFLSS